MDRNCLNSILSLERIPKLLYNVTSSVVQSCQLFQVIIENTQCGFGARDNRIVSVPIYFMSKVGVSEKI